LNLADHVGDSIGSVPLVRAGERIAKVTVAGHTVEATAASTVTMLSWPGVDAHRQMKTGRTVHAGTKAGTRIGSVVVKLGTQRAVIPVRLRNPLPKATIFQRLF
jgi:hypothetical protein